jgi:hypothetical protein
LKAGKIPFANFEVRPFKWIWKIIENLKGPLACLSVAHLPTWARAYAVRPVVAVVLIAPPA